MTSFHEVRFPNDLAYGATGGSEYATNAEPSAQALLVGARHVDAEGAVSDKKLHKRWMRLLAQAEVRAHAKDRQTAE